MTIAEKLKVIVNEWVENKVDDRTWDEVYDHMLDWNIKGWLANKWVDGAYSAIERGLEVRFSYDPKEKCYGYLAGSKQAWADFEKANLKKAKVTVVEVNGKKV